MNWINPLGELVEKHPEDAIKLSFCLFVFWAYSGLVVSEAYYFGTVIGNKYLLIIAFYVFTAASVWLGTFFTRVIIKFIREVKK
jgi:hypothetical protein